MLVRRSKLSVFYLQIQIVFLLRCYRSFMVAACRRRSLTPNSPNLSWSLRGGTRLFRCLLNTCVVLFSRNNIHRYCWRTRLKYLAVLYTPLTSRQPVVGGDIIRVTTVRKPPYVPVAEQSAFFDRTILLRIHIVYGVASCNIQRVYINGGGWVCDLTNVINTLLLCTRTRLSGVLYLFFNQWNALYATGVYGKKGLVRNNNNIKATVAAVVVYDVCMCVCVESHTCIPVCIYTHVAQNRV